ncbi:Kef-type K+ transport system membrane component KefB [Saccharothrix coeruleofusca]|uniref:DUF6223 family protein n=1 Tax=Saccharothrix coeruleofusca TaxID=33919 RepID=UPI001AE55271|nr:DUF6223 family protein [Saccharothrix coeruleofusca]MBP2339755.1 Kef-type K+ transport system membrane component KefB [Saccharothrix coeruleofusca]
MSAHHLLAEPITADVQTLTAGRVWSFAALLLAVAGVVIGGSALARPAGRAGRGRAALAAGLVSAVVGGLVVAAAEGGPGTGYGIVGGFAALAAGLVAAVLGGLVLARSRRADRPGASR